MRTVVAGGRLARRAAFVRTPGGLAVAATVVLGVALASWKHAPQRSALDAYEGFPDVHPSLLVSNPRALLSLEIGGFSFGDVFGIREIDALRPVDYGDESTAILHRSPLYADLVATLQQDLDELSRASPYIGVGASFEHRLFDSSWLASDRAHFELVAVVNRIDFRSLVPPGCGQTRLVYRLAYRPPERPQTRLPMTVSVIYENRERSCAEVAHRWLIVERTEDVPAALRSGPLAGIDPRHFDRLEIDVQSMRENSTGAEMDDHAEYMLRAFNVGGGHLVPDKLRNTPATELSSESRQALRDWIAQHVDAIDSGAAEIPAEFLATRAVSVAPRGLARAANRPFETLFPDEDEAFHDLAFAGRRVVTSPWMLARRLDEMTCVGCHESHTVAGFHLLGEDRTGDVFNGMVLGISEYLREILDWRYAFLVSAAEGTSYSKPVPVPEHVDDRGGYGAHCIIPRASDDELPDWRCAAGFICDSPVAGNPVGQCVPDGSKRAGDPCQSVALATRRTIDGDKVTPRAAQDCSSPPLPGARTKRATCEPNRNGFAGGMCTSSCNTLGETPDGAVCIRIPHHGFERECFRPGVLIEQCLETAPNFTMTTLRKCSRNDPCRDDFVCARVPSEPPDRGACVPPYFIFQARVDGPPTDR